MSGQEFPHSPSQHSLTPQTQLRLPLLPLHPQPRPQPQPRLHTHTRTHTHTHTHMHPLQPSGSFSEGGPVAVQICKIIIFRGGGCKVPARGGRLHCNTCTRYSRQEVLARGGRLHCNTVKSLFLGGAVAHFDHKILIFSGGAIFLAGENTKYTVIHRVYIHIYIYTVLANPSHLSLPNCTIPKARASLIPSQCTTRPSLYIIALLLVLCQNRKAPFCAIYITCI